MAVDLKAATPDATFAWATAVLFGADSQASASPSVYAASTALTALLALSNTWAAKQTITPLVNTNALAVTGYSLTGSNASSLIDLAGTWNTTGVPTAFKLNITDTASDAASLLFDFQVGGSSLITGTKSGRVLANIFANRANTSLLSFESVGGAPGIALYTSGGLNLPTGSLYFANSQFLTQDAADFLAQRNATAAQTYRVYNTFTNSSNYERLSIGWASNVAIVKAENAGTGSARLFVPVTGATVVGSLPSAATMGAGARSFVTDALTPVFGNAVSAGGAAKVPVVSDGISWLVG